VQSYIVVSGRNTGEQQDEEPVKRQTALSAEAHRKCQNS
jgi:hypothetical protein